MKKIAKTLFGIMLSVSASFAMLMKPSFAKVDECVKTSLFQDSGSDCYSGGIWGILGIGIDVLTIAIGAAAVIGLILSGIQYTSSSGDPAAMTKSKKRMFEILLGILVYGVFYAGIRWLIPNY